MLIGSYRRVATAGILLVVGLCVSNAASTRAFADPLPDVLPGKVDRIEFPVDNISYPSYDANGVEGQTEWRVVGGLDSVNTPGNYAEQYLSTTPNGRLLDFSTYPQYSDDRGESWYEVHTKEPLFGNEGAISAAPNGDIVGIDWYAETADRIVSFKYDASSDKWSYAYGSLRTPFFDRPWLTPIPGPYSVDGDSGPYAVLLQGGYPKGDPPYYASVDGLHYIHVSYKTVDGEVYGATNDPFPSGTSSDLDFIQPQSQGDMFPLVHGSITENATGEWYVTDAPDVKWQRYDPFNSVPVGAVLQDSLGRLHYISFGSDSTSKSFQYWMSSDGGATWDKQTVRLPQGDSIASYLDWDAKTSAQAGVTAIALHATQSGTGDTQDLLYKFSLASGRPVLDRLYKIGLGDVAATSGVISETAPARFDFSSVAIFPDGRVATSFEDSRHTANALAVELDTTTPSQPPAVDLPSTRITEPRDHSRNAATAITQLAGTSQDGAGFTNEVDVALMRRVGSRCLWLRDMRWERQKCDTPAWQKADDIVDWTLDLPHVLPAGDYEAFSRAVGVGPLGQDYAEQCCVDGINHVSFEVEPSRSRRSR